MLVPSPLCGRVRLPDTYMYALVALVRVRMRTPLQQHPLICPRAPPCARLVSPQEVLLQELPRQQRVAAQQMFGARLQVGGGGGVRRPARGVRGEEGSGCPGWRHVSCGTV